MSPPPSRSSSGGSGPVERVRFASVRLPSRSPISTAAYAALRARGVTFLDAPHLIARLPDHELWMAFCRDSEANLLGLMSEVTAP